MPGMSPPRVAVVVLNFNGLDDTVICLESLRPVRERGHDIVLVDNASKQDPEVASRAVLPDLVYERTGRNLGYAGGNNVGFRIALERGADFVLVLNNDTVVAPTIVEDLLGAFDADPALGIVGPVINFMDEPGTVMTDGVAFNPGPGTEFFRRVVVTPRADATPAVPVDIVNGCCMMIRADVLRRVGLFDERLFIIHEEADLCLRTIRAGFGCAVLPKTLVWHKGSSAFERSGRQVQRYFDARNLYYLLRRHAGRVSRSRSLVRTLPHYFKYCFYRYDIELDAGKPAAAMAVVNGVADALRGRTGPADFGAGTSCGVICRLFRAARAMRGRRPAAG